MYSEVKKAKSVENRNRLISRFLLPKVHFLLPTSYDFVSNMFLIPFVQKGSKTVIKQLLKGFYENVFNNGRVCKIVGNGKLIKTIEMFVSFFIVPSPCSLF
jgi:hypothetical protein